MKTAAQLPEWIADRMKETERQLAAKATRDDKVRQFEIAVNELMRDFDVTTAQRLAFIEAVANSAFSILGR